MRIDDGRGNERDRDEEREGYERGTSEHWNEAKHSRQTTRVSSER